MPKLFALVFNKDLPWSTEPGTAACWCNEWREVRIMLRYYGRGEVCVYRVRGQRPSHFPGGAEDRRLTALLGEGK